MSPMHITQYDSFLQLFGPVHCSSKEKLALQKHFVKENWTGRVEQGAEYKRSSELREEACPGQSAILCSRSGAVHFEQ